MALFEWGEYMMMQNAGALSGVVVLDLTRVVAGPFATSWLADMGATVIKIENPGDGGDHSRASVPFVDDISAWYSALNRSKKPVTLNLKDPRGKHLFMELVKKADVVTENFRPGVMDRLGVGYEDIKKVNPKIIMASVSGYGSFGPYSQRPGYDVVAQGMGGIMSLTGFPDAPPTRCGTTLGDITAGMNLVIGILAALHSARTTGVGQKLEVALVDSIFSLCAFEFVSYTTTGILPGRKGNNYYQWCPYGTYKAADGYYQLGVGTDKHFSLLCEKVMGRPDMAQDSRYVSHAARLENRATLDAAIDAWASAFSVAEVVEKLNAAGVPGCAVYDLSDIEKDPHFAQRDMIKKMQLSGDQEVRYANMPIHFFGTPNVEPTAPGALGRCNQEVYSQILGLDENKINELRMDGVI